ncbi:MAG: serine hydrolase [Flavipsychrobacter sp.]
MKRILLLTASFCMLALGTKAQNKTKAIDSVVKVYQQHGSFNGSVLVYQYGRPVLVKGYGYRDVAKKLLNDSNTVFQIGSVTKTFTATMIMMLQEQGKLNVKDKLNKYFPDYPDGDKITIENLLTHTSGIFNYTEDTSFSTIAMTQHQDRKAMMRVFKDRMTGIEPGTNFYYSNSNYLLLGYIIEDLTGKTYYSALRSMILDPLGMKNTGCNFAGLKSKNKAVGYFSIDDGRGDNAPVIDSSVSYAAGCVYTTVSDLNKWATAVHRKQLLTEEDWKLVTTVYKQNYGYGWMLGEAMGKKSIGHNGGIHGFVSNMFMMPDDASTVILISNKMDDEHSQLRRNITAILNDKKPELPEFKTEIKLNPVYFKDYIGVYTLAPGFEITISQDGDALYAQATGQKKLRLYAERKDFFFFKVVDAQISFMRNDAQAVDKLALRQNGRIMNAPKKK